MDETVIMIRHTFFWGRESSSFMLVFLSSRYKCRLLHFSLQMCSFLHRLILKSVFVEKKCRKCSSSTSKVDCHKMMLMIRRASRDPGIASIFSKKNGTSGTNEFLPKMSSNRCCVFIARIDLAKIMKLMLRVSSESKYSFFNRKVIEHIVEKMDVVV